MGLHPDRIDHRVDPTPVRVANHDLVGVFFAKIDDVVAVPLRPAQPLLSSGTLMWVYCACGTRRYSAWPPATSPYSFD